jgi:hypothetical protein
MRTFRGEDIEDNTIIYYLAYTSFDNLSYETCAKRVYKHRIHRGLTFVYDPIDNLYATPSVREYWTHNPCRHPYVTLFSILILELNDLERYLPFLQQ